MGSILFLILSLYNIQLYATRALLITRFTTAGIKLGWGGKIQADDGPRPAILGEFSVEKSLNLMQN